MKTHFTIAPPGNFADTMARIEARALRDKRIVIYRSAESVHWLVFCDTVELAANLAERLQAGGSVNPSFCAVELDAKFDTIRVNQECGEASREIMVEFIIWVLGSFSGCLVFDEDSDAELTQQAATCPEELFR